MTRYRSYAELAANEIHDRDYRITVTYRGVSPVAIIAPHAGSIERRTTHIAREIAGDDFNLYLFEGLDSNGSFDELHITSHQFDEPTCLALIASCDVVVAVHGCHRKEEAAYIGGLNLSLKHRLADAIRAAGVPVSTDGHDYPGTNRHNICNRGAGGQGVQLELTDALRGGDREPRMIDNIRSVLLDCHGRRQVTARGR